MFKSWFAQIWRVFRPFLTVGGAELAAPPSGVFCGADTKARYTWKQRGTVVWHLD